METTSTSTDRWAFQLSYQSQLRVEQPKVSLKNHAMRMIDRFMKLCNDAQISAASSLNIVNA